MKAIHYVYGPESSRIGMLEQQRRVETISDERARIIDTYQFLPELADHPLAVINGTRQYEASVEERSRIFHGPDVVGIGIMWGDKVILSEGLWPQLTHNFSSLSFQLRGDRRLSVIRFHNAGHPVATLIGVASPDEQAVSEMVLNGAYWAGIRADRWEGSIETYHPSGKRTQEGRMVRRIAGMSWRDEADYERGSARLLSIDLETWSPSLLVGGSVLGVGTVTGWLLDIEAMQGPETTLRMTELLDNEAGYLIGIRRWYQFQQLERLEISTLRPAS